MNEIEKLIWVGVFTQILTQRTGGGYYGPIVANNDDKNVAKAAESADNAITLFRKVGSKLVRE